MRRFLLYCLIKKNRPSVYPEICLPGFVSGVIWAIAQTSWFVANQELSFMVTFPIISVGPGMVGSLWGIFLYSAWAGGCRLTRRV
jgi:glucose uptake protein GlcU